MKNKNFVILWIRDSLFAAAASLTSASVLTGFLKTVGTADDKISLYLAAVPAVNLVISLLFSGITSRARKTVHTYSLLCLASGILTAAYALLFGTVRAGRIMFVFLMILGCLLSSVTAVRNIFDYKLPCEVMEPDSYSSYISVSGLISSAFGVGAGAILSLGCRKLELTLVTCLAYLTAGLCYTAASVINRSLKPVSHIVKAEKVTSEKGSVAELFSDRAFLILFFPNLIRGIGMAAVPMMALIGINSGVISEADGAPITVCNYIGTFLSCIIYAYLAKKIGVARLGIFGAFVFCALVPTVSFGRKTFFVLYTVAYIGYYIVSCALPDAVYKSVNPRQMSVFHTWRLALTTIGTTVSTAVIGKLIGRVSPVLILLAGVISHIICTVAYYAVFRNQLKNNSATKL